MRANAGSHFRSWLPKYVKVTVPKMLTSEIKYQEVELSQEFLLAMKVEVTKF